MQLTPAPVSGEPQAALPELLAQLDATMADARLSDDERRVLVHTLREASPPEDGLRQLRNRAFDLVRARTDSVDVRYTGETGAPVPAHISREVPAAQFDLPSLALSVEGGGTVAMRSGGQAGDKPRTLEGLFVFDVAPERAEKHLLLGSRVFVRFGHGSEPLIWRWVRSVRQTFLSRFNV